MSNLNVEYNFNAESAVCLNSALSSLIIAGFLISSFVIWLRNRRVQIRQNRVEIIQASTEAYPTMENMVTMQSTERAQRINQNSTPEGCVNQNDRNQNAIKEEQKWTGNNEQMVIEELEYYENSHNNAKKY